MSNRTDIKSALRQMLAVLEQERQALARLDLDSIIGCTNEKDVLCGQLAGAANDNPDTECLSLIDSVKRLNEVNRQVRNLAAANVAARIEALLGAPSLYRANGAQTEYARLGSVTGA